MTIGVLHYWNYLAFYVDRKLEKAEYDFYRDKVIAKFRDSTIKTEKLYNNDVLFAFRLNNKERVICTVGTHHDKNCLVILDILPNHEYSSCKYLNRKSNFELNPNDIKIVASQPNEANCEIVNDPECRIVELPIICSARIDKKTIIVGKNQLAILERQVNLCKPTFLKVSGVAGSGKTTISELLIYKQLNYNNILYVTKSLHLAAYIKSRYEKTVSSLNAENHSDKNHPQITSYQAHCCGPIFEILFDDNNFSNFNDYVRRNLKETDKEANLTRQNPTYQNVLEALGKNNIPGDEDINSSYLPGYLAEKLCYIREFMEWVEDIPQFQEYARNEKLRIGREIYEDIRKLSDKGSSCSENISLGKKESYGHPISLEIFKLYTKHLHSTGKVDLSLMNPNARRNYGVDKNQYDLILVDEAQDFRKTELKYITTFLRVNNRGSIYFFMDSNQSLLDDFNLTSQYINELAIESGSEIEEYKLADAYRMPRNVTAISNTVLQIKRDMIGGALSKDEQGYLYPVEVELTTAQTGESPDKSLGYIGWIEVSDVKSSKEEKQSSVNLDSSQEVLENLKKEAAHSISLAIIIPHNSALSEVRNIFPNSIVFTPEEVKGLEFQKIVLFNFFSGNYEFNHINSTKNTRFLGTDMNKSTNFPKDAKLAKEMGKHSQFFSNLFISITRTTDSLYFIETHKLNRAPLYFKAKFEMFMNKGKHKKVNDSSIGDIVAWIQDNENKLVSNKLLEYCEKALTKINAAIEGLKELTEPKMNNDKVTEYLFYMVELVNSISSTIHNPADFAKFFDCLKTTMTDLLNYSKDIDINDTIFSKSLHISHEVGNSVFDELKHMDSNLIEIVNTRDHNDKSALDYVTQQKRYDLSCMLILYGAKITSLSEQQKRELLLYASNLTHVAYSGQEHELRPIVGLLALKVPEAVLKYNDFYQYPRLLSYFCLHGHTKVIASLLSAIEDKDRRLRIINKADNSATPLNNANSSYQKMSDEDHLEIIRYLFEQGATKTVNNVDPIYLTQQTAASIGHLETFKYAVSQTEEKSYFAQWIGVAARKNHLNIIDYIWNNFLQYTTDNAGNTALHYTAWKGGLASVEYLCKHGAEINQVNKNGLTPCDVAIENNTMDVVKFLVQECNAIGGNWDLSLTFTVNLFVRATTDSIDEVNSLGCNLLHTAVLFGELIFVRHLVGLGIDVNKRNIHGETPLHLAVVRYDDDITKFLLQHGVMYDVPCNNNKTPVNIAQHRNTLTMNNVHNLFTGSKLFENLDKIIKWTGCFDDAYDPANPMAFYLNVRNIRGQSLLHRAVVLNDEKATNLLLEYNESYGHIRNTLKMNHAKDFVPIDFSARDSNGYTPLHLAAAFGNIEIAKALIRKRRRDVSVVNNLGETPLDVARRKGHRKIVKLLYRKD